MPMSLLGVIILPLCLLLIVAERINYYKKRKELLNKLFPTEITAESAEMQKHYVKKYRIPMKGRFIDKGAYRYEFPRGFIKKYYEEVIEPATHLTKASKDDWRVVMEDKGLMPDREGIPVRKILKAIIICFALFMVIMTWYHLPIRHYNEDGSYDDVTGIFRPIYVESYLEDGTKVLMKSYDYNGLNNKTEQVSFLNGSRAAGYKTENGRLTEIYDGGYYSHSKAVKAQIEYTSEDSFVIEVYGRESEYDTGYDDHFATIKVRDGGSPEFIKRESTDMWYEITSGGETEPEKFYIKISWNDYEGFQGGMTIGVWKNTFNMTQVDESQWTNYILFYAGDDQYISGKRYDSNADNTIYEYVKVQ